MEPTIIQAALGGVAACVAIATSAAYAYDQGYKRGSQLTGNYYRTRAREHVERREEKTVTTHSDGVRSEQHYTHSVTSPQPDKV